MRHSEMLYANCQSFIKKQQFWAVLLRNVELKINKG